MEKKEIDLNLCFLVLHKSGVELNKVDA